MYHAIACLTAPKLSNLGEHSEVNQAQYHDRLETTENSQSTNSAKTLKIFKCLLKFGLIKIMSQFFNDLQLEFQNPGS